MSGKEIYKRRIFNLLILFSLILLFCGFVAASSDVAYIYKNIKTVDDNVLDVFNELGLSVDKINEKDASKTDFSNYKFIFVGDERFRNEEKIPIGDVPSVISNYYFGYEWGLTDDDGISKLASNSPLNVRKDGKVVQVYTKAIYNGGTISIPYYFLDDENKVPEMQKIAGTYIGTEYDFGDVISYAGAGTDLINGHVTNKKLCFFGIIESDYWTNAAREMFKDCIGYVGITCYDDDECGDVETGDEFCKLDGNVYQEVEEYECKNPGTVQSQCVDDVVAKLVEDCGDSYCDAYENNYCKNTDVYRKRNCYDKGCSSGECYSNTNQEEQLLIDCQYGCIAGECIQSTCEDKDYDNYDTCDPGEPGDDGKEIDCNDNNADVHLNATELCNGVDDDCDGLIDENFSDLGNSCSVGIGECMRIGSTVCKLDGTGTKCSAVAGTPSLEICDNLDNDCDGLIDEGDICVTECNDNLDNDADLLIDEADPGCWDDPGNPLTYNPDDDNESDSTINCDKNSDCGTDGFTGNKYCVVKDAYQNYKEYECKNPGLGTSYCNDSTEKKLVEICAYECANGQCIGECSEENDCGTDYCESWENYCKGDEVWKTRTCTDFSCLSHECSSELNTEDVFVEECDVCMNGKCMDITCNKDSDCGTDGFLGNLYCDGMSDDDVWQNYRDWTCENPGTVSSSCSQTISPKEVVDCTDTCLDGACIDIVCYIDLDCDDSNPDTSDYCNNPGTIESYCSHEDILCFEDYECGTDRFIGGLYCKNDDIYRELMSFECKNPGLFSSFCSNNISEEFVDSCQYACANGICVRCNDNIDCEDDDSTTLDICWYSGTVDSYCSHEHIECEEDLDCGEDGYVKTPYCIGGDIYQKYRIFDCVNKGTPGSYCSGEEELVLIEECAYGCSDGKCIDGIHDVALIDFTGSIGGIKIQDMNGTVLTANDKLMCQQDYKIFINVENQGDFVENVTFEGQIDGLTVNHNPKDNLAPGEDSTKYKQITMNLFAGIYNIIIQAIIGFDENPGNNFASRQIEVICPECFENQECGEDNYSDAYCKNKDVYKEFQEFTCVNNECNEELTEILFEDCGEDSCGDYGDNYCKGDDVYHERMCAVNGCENGACVSSVYLDEKLVEECAYECVGGECIEDSCHVCFTPDNLGDTSKENVGSHQGEPVLQTVLNNKGYSFNVNNDQTNIQVWNANKKVKLEITYLAKYSLYGHDFGYYLNGDKNTFVKLFNDGSVAIGSKYTVYINEGDTIGFAIKNSEDDWRYTENALNSNSKDHVIVFDDCDEFVLGFEDDLNIDNDYQDIVVSVKRISCE